VALPGMNERRLADEVVARANGVKVLFMTDYSRNAVTPFVGNLVIIFSYPLLALGSHIDSPDHVTRTGSFSGC
jgi:hypothetical protein